MSLTEVTTCSGVLLGGLVGICFGLALGGWWIPAATLGAMLCGLVIGGVTGEILVTRS